MIVSIVSCYRLSFCIQLFAIRHVRVGPVWPLIHACVQRHTVETPVQCLVRVHFTLFAHDIFSFLPYRNTHCDKSVPHYFSQILGTAKRMCARTEERVICWLGLSYAHVHHTSLEYHANFVSFSILYREVKTSSYFWLFVH